MDVEAAICGTLWVSVYRNCSNVTFDFDFFQSSWRESWCKEIVVQEVVKVSCSNAAERLHAGERIVKRCREHRQHWSRSFRVSTVTEFVCVCKLTACCHLAVITTYRWLFKMLCP